MRHTSIIGSCVLMIAPLLGAPAASAQSTSTDRQFCNQRTVTEAAASLTRDWGERYKQNFVEQVVKPGWTSVGTVVEASASQVVCRLTFSNITTSTYPVRRLKIVDADFRYSEVAGEPHIEPISFPLSGLDERSAIVAVSEKLFVDEKSYRSMLEERAEQDPQMAAALSAIVGRPKGTEGAAWGADKFCQMIGASGAAGAIISWAEKTNQVRATGLTSKETPTWLPPTSWKVANLKAISSIPFQSVICSADVSYTGNKFDGTRVPMEIRGMPYKLWGNDDGSQVFVETHHWPSEQESGNGDNAFNRAWVVNGRTFDQDWTAKKQQAVGQPKNIIEAMTQQQAAYNQQLESYAKSQGIDVEAMKKADAEKTRRYAEPCRRSGGTWGYPTDKYGNAGQLGCYHPTGER